MANMNPLRDDILAAQEPVVQLKRELAEKNKLIYKLQNPEPKKPKQPRKPTNWPKWFKKAAKISAIVLGSGALLTFCTFTCEPNDMYVAKGTIVGIKSQKLLYADSCQRPNENGKIVEMTGIACGQKSPDGIFYILQVEFEDRYNGQRIIDVEHEIKTEKMTESVPYIGCVIDVYHKLGLVFRDKPWFKRDWNFSQPNNHVDTSMCKKREVEPAE